MEILKLSAFASVISVLVEIMSIIVSWLSILLNRILACLEPLLFSRRGDYLLYVFPYTQISLCSAMLDCKVSATILMHEGRLISNVHSELSRKRDHVFKQTKVGSKVQYFSYKLTYLFFDIVALSFNTFFPT